MPGRNHPRLLPGAIALLLAASVTPGARAGAPEEGVPRQVLVPWRFAADQDDVQAVTGHAAGLGWLGRGSVFEAEIGLGASAAITGARQTDGVLALGAARLGPVALGLGYARAGTERFELDTNRFDFALAYRAMPWLGLGFRWAELWSESPTGPSYGTGSVSVTLRPDRMVSLAVDLDRFNRPRQGGAFDEPMARLAVGIRPGSERVIFGIDGAVEAAERPSWYAGGSLRIMPVPGLVLGGYGRYVGESGGPDRLEWGGYLAIEQSGVTAEVSLDRYDPTGRGGPNGMSASLLVRTGTHRTADLVTPSRLVPRITISGDLPERPGDGVLTDGRPPFAFWLAGLDAMAADSDVEAVVVDLGAAPGWGQSWELRQAFVRLRQAGKRVYVRVTTAHMRSFYLASAADRVFLDPSGVVHLMGLSVTRTYYAGLLSKLGVRAQFVKYEEYKSAPEAYTQSGPSDPAMEQSNALMKAFDDAWFDAMEQGRGLERAALDAVIAGGPHTFDMAHRDGLVDRVVADHEVEDAVSEDLGYPIVLTRGYRPPPRAWHRWQAPRQIAILPVVGSIVDGSPTPIELPLPFLGAQTGDHDFVHALRVAVADPSVVGIIVRVDSPGGSVTASDRMYQAVKKASEDKPVVISFGDVAASGGYYLACGSSTILATPLTITGSIGIFNGKVDLSGLYELLGLTTWTDKTAPHADAMGMHRAWTPDEEETARQRLRAYYDRFVGLVATARKLSPEDARERARGRVMIGDEAMTLRLVDGRGGFWEAIQHVRKQAGLTAIERVDLSYRPAPGLLAEVSGFLLGAFGAGTTATPPPDGSVTARVGRWLATLEHLSRGGVQARMPYDLEID